MIYVIKYKLRKKPWCSDVWQMPKNTFARKTL